MSANTLNLVTAVLFVLVAASVCWSAFRNFRNYERLMAYMKELIERPVKVELDVNPTLEVAAARCPKCGYEPRINEAGFVVKPGDTRPS